MTSISKIIFVFFCLCLISGCGQTGPLYLPDKSETEKTDAPKKKNLNQDSATQQK